MGMRFHSLRLLTIGGANVAPASGLETYPYPYPVHFLPLELEGEPTSLSLPRISHGILGAYANCMRLQSG